MAAFDWSPGGCCCDVTFWFDVFQFDGRTPNHVQRLGSVQPATQQTNSFTDSNWFITPSSAVENQEFTGRSFVCAYKTADDILWSVERRSGSYRVTQYNAGTKSEAFSYVVETAGALRVNHSGSRWPSHSGIRGAMAAGPIYFAIIAAGPTVGFGIPSDRLILVSPSGVAITPSIVIYRTDQTNTPTGSSWDVEQPDVIAPRSWPIAASTLETRYFAGATNLQFKAKFLVGDLEVDQGAWRILNPTNTLDKSSSVVVPPGESFSYQGIPWGTPSFIGIGTDPTWLYFDANGGNWIGVILWTTYERISASNFRPVYHCALASNGQIIKQYDDVGELGRTNMPHAWGAPHVAVGGDCIIPWQEYATSPGPSSPAGVPLSPRSWRLKVYRGGNEIWQSPLSAGEPIVAHSSDRWFYTTLPGIDMADMPASVFTDGVRDHWLIRPDGTACAPMGKRNADGSTPPPITQNDPLYSPALGMETIKHSELYTDVPPAEPF